MENEKVQQPAPVAGQEPVLWAVFNANGQAVYTHATQESVVRNARFIDQPNRVVGLVEATPVPAASVQPVIRLAAERARRAYIAGPMTGIVDYNFPAFNALAAAMRADGWHVENPAEHGIVEGADWADYLRHDITRIATCDTIVLLPGWSKSKGAKLELHIAQQISMNILLSDGAETVQPDSGRDAALVAVPAGWALVPTDHSVAPKVFSKMVLGAMKVFSNKGYSPAKWEGNHTALVRGIIAAALEHQSKFPESYASEIAAHPAASVAQGEGQQDPIVEANVALLRERSALGVRKYGTTLAENPLTHAQWLRHALEEVLDLGNYLQAAIAAHGGKGGTA